MKSFRVWGLWALGLFLSGCATRVPWTPPPLVTELPSSPVVIPGRMYGNFLVIESKWDRFGPYHFIIDTGATLTLVTPELAGRYGAAPAGPGPAASVHVRSSDGTTTTLPPRELTRLDLGGARYENVPALVFDFSPLTAQLGVKIDGVLGFSLFRQTLLTLDYPQSRVVLQSPALAAALRGAALAFTSSDKTPEVTITIGLHDWPALIDSGSSDTMSLDPAGHGLRFSAGPIEGPTVGTLTGDRVEHLVRLDDTLFLGEYAVSRPPAVVTDQPATIGGGILKFFTVTFDQVRDRAILYREAAGPVSVPGVRTAGLSFSKTPVYWRVVGVIHGSPADGAKVQPGDLITRIDHEPVAKWDAQRYEKLLAGEGVVAFTFLNGTQERTLPLRVVELVP